MWVARDKNNSLWLYKEKPYRNEIYECWQSEDPYVYVGPIDKTLFPNLKWEDEPIEVTIIEKQNL